MKKIDKIFGLGILSLAALSCTKVGPEAGSDELIAVGAEVARTKAMIDGKFNPGSTITVYDWLDPTTGNDRYHMEDVGVLYSGNDWSYVVDYPHRWEEGKHKFFGWITQDAGMPANCDTPAEFFGSGFKFESDVLTIPEKIMDASVDQFDFVYSEIYNREYYKSVLNSGRYVELEMKHLFTAVSIGVENSTSSYVKVEEFRIENIPTTRSATINYGGASVAVNYSNWTSETTTIGLVNGYTVDPEGRYGNIFNGSTAQEYMMLWPIEAERLHSTDDITEGEEIDYPESWKMYIKYTVDGNTYEKRINFPDKAWEAGKKNQLTIVFADKMVELKVLVKDWEYESQEIDYSNDGVAVTDNHTLTWKPDTYNAGSDPSLRYAYIKNGMPVEGTFQLEAPMGGTWLATLTGDIDAFDISPTSGVIDGNAATIKVAPKPEALGLQRDFKVKVKFAVRRPDGRTISADSVLQPAGTEYTIILSAN